MHYTHCTQSWCCKKGKKINKAQITVVVIQAQKRQKWREMSFIGKMFLYIRTWQQPRLLWVYLRRGLETLDSCYVTVLKVSEVVPGQCRSSHVSLYSDSHGDASAPDVAQLLRHSDAVAEVQSQASILCRGRNTHLFNCCWHLTLSASLCTDDFSLFLYAHIILYFTTELKEEETLVTQWR